MPTPFLIKAAESATPNNTQLIDKFFETSREEDPVCVDFAFGSPPNTPLPKNITFFRKGSYYAFHVKQHRRKIINDYLQDNHLQLADIETLYQNSTTVNRFFNDILKQHICQSLCNVLDLTHEGNESSFNNTQQNFDKSLLQIVTQQTVPAPFIEVNPPADGNCFYHAAMISLVYNALTGQISENSPTALALKTLLLPKIYEQASLDFNPAISLHEAFIRLLQHFNYTDKETHDHDKITLIQDTNWNHLLSITHMCLRQTLYDLAKKDINKIDRQQLAVQDINHEVSRRMKPRSNATRIRNEAIEALCTANWLTEQETNNGTPIYLATRSRVNHYLSRVLEENRWAGEVEKKILTDALNLKVVPYAPQNSNTSTDDSTTPQLYIRLDQGNHFHTGMPRSTEKNEHNDIANALSHTITTQKETPLIDGNELLKHLKDQIEKIKPIISSLKDRGYKEDAKIITNTKTLITVLKGKQGALEVILNDKKREPKQSEIQKIQSDCIGAIQNTLKENPSIKKHPILNRALRAFADVLMVCTLGGFGTVIAMQAYSPEWSKFTLFSMVNTRSHQRLKIAEQAIRTLECKKTIGGPTRT